MKGIFSGLLAKHKKYYHLASEMVAGLLRLYPGAFTIMDGYKITSTENKAALILFLEAGYLNTAYSQLLRQTSELVNLAKQSKAYQRIQQYEKLGKKPAATTA